MRMRARGWTGRSRLRIWSSRRSDRSNGSPPDKITSRISECSARYWNALSNWDIGIFSGSPTLRRRVQNRQIQHLEIIRIGSRVPCHLPERITPELCDTLKRYHPLYINTHFNHPDELTPAAGKGLGMLADAGVPLGCQTVLLKGVNDDADVMKELMQRLLAARVRPYYISIGDQGAGAGHFRRAG